jgi:hypothetical protein
MGIRKLKSIRPPDSGRAVNCDRCRATAWYTKKLHNGQGNIQDAIARDFREYYEHYGPRVFLAHVCRVCFTRVKDDIHSM